MLPARGSQNSRLGLPRVVQNLVFCGPASLGGLLFHDSPLARILVEKSQNAKFKNVVFCWSLGPKSAPGHSYLESPHLTVQFAQVLVRIRALPARLVAIQRFEHPDFGTSALIYCPGPYIDLTATPLPPTPVARRSQTHDLVTIGRAAEQRSGTNMATNTGVNPCAYACACVA